ncbi:PEP-CTERM sorting domain-containing protein [Thalassomonas sp. RHCl1]|uniref:PEP-CTERM sorting domain-containing protein n=1 Tax=Thalassomonas sp. RHCl1 TaxID=2995320 RepID=UPI00248BE22F|nr:PEP-CTERM sorting domain-containing protein [Thalassomonas sp. RHCl1]
MCSIRSMAISFLLAICSAQASATLIFDFEIDSFSPININGQIGDKFSIAVDSEADLETGVSMSDVLWVSYDTAYLGYQLIDDFVLSYDDELLAQFFTFTDLGNDLWQFDILVGLTDDNRLISFQKNNYSLQFGQTDDGSGAMSLSMLSPGEGVLAHEPATTRVFSAQAALPVPEPGALAIFLLGLVGVARQTRTRK